MFCVCVLSVQGCLSDEENVWLCECMLPCLESTYLFGLYTGISTVMANFDLKLRKLVRGTNVMIRTMVWTMFFVFILYQNRTVFILCKKQDV